MITQLKSIILDDNKKDNRVKNLLKIAISIMLGVSIISTQLFSDVAKGQKIYTKKLKVKCGISGSSFAGKHSQDQWEEIYDAGKLDEEIRKICHGNSVDSKSLPDIYDFVYEYANDSGNVPSI